MLQLISFHCPSSDCVVSMWKQKIESPWFRINYNTMRRNLFHFHEKIWKPVWIFYLKIKGILNQRKKLNTKKKLQNPTKQPQYPKTNKPNQTNQQTKPTQPPKKPEHTWNQWSNRWGLPREAEVKESTKFISHTSFSPSKCFCKTITSSSRLPFHNTCGQFIIQWGKDRGSFLASFGKKCRIVGLQVFCVGLPCLGYLSLKFVEHYLRLD